MSLWCRGRSAISHGTWHHLKFWSEQQSLTQGNLHGMLGNNIWPLAGFNAACRFFSSARAGYGADGYRCRMPLHRYACHNSIRNGWPAFFTEFCQRMPRECPLEAGRSKLVFHNVMRLVHSHMIHLLRLKPKIPKMQGLLVRPMLSNYSDRAFYRNLLTRMICWTIAGSPWMTRMIW